MKVRCLDGKVFEGRNYREIVEKIRADSWFPEVTKAEWMAKAAYRAKIQSGIDVSSSDAKSFIEDLVDAALVTIIEP